jgi:ATP-binding cassette, subfamily C, bacterial CydCD
LTIEIRLAERQDEITARAGRYGAAQRPVRRRQVDAAARGEPVPGTRVLLAGASATAIDRAALTEHVTLVAQDAHVFDATIRQNLQLADERADEAELWAALSAAALSETVAAFPDRLDTPSVPVRSRRPAASAAA